MEDFLLGEEDILQRVDEYSLYSFYLGFDPELSVDYESPIRAKDTHPSFAVFYSKKMPNREFAWKDQGSGYSGDIFVLVKLLYGYQRKGDAVRQIASDFNLGEKLDRQRRMVFATPPKLKEPSQIRVIARRWEGHDLRWWSQFHVDRALLELYRICPISCYWTYPSQKIPRFPGKGLGYDYRIGKRHKLYFPLESKDFKFRNDLGEEDLEGFNQLSFQQPTLVITKSMKDIMCLRSFGYEAVSPRGENTLIPDAYLRYLETRYERIYTLFDNDGKHKAAEYPYMPLEIPVIWQQKDPTDFCRCYGPQACSELLQQLIP